MQLYTGKIVPIVLIRVQYFSTDQKIPLNVYNYIPEKIVPIVLIRVQYFSTALAVTRVNVMICT